MCSGPSFIAVGEIAISEIDVLRPLNPSLNSLNTFFQEDMNIFTLGSLA